MRRWPISAVCLVSACCILLQACSFFKRAEPVVFEETPLQDGTLEETCDLEDSCFDDPFRFCPEDFAENLGNQYELQGVLLNDAIVALLEIDSPDIIENAEENALANAREMAALFQPIYGPDVAAQMECLNNRQVQLLYAYVDALRCQNRALADDFLMQSYAHGHLMVEFFNIMNPYYPYRPERFMMDEHVTLQSDQALAYAQGDFDRAEDLKERSIAQMKEMALHIAKALQTQFSDSATDRYDWVDDCPYYEDDSSRGQPFDDPEMVVEEIPETVM